MTGVTRKLGRTVSFCFTQGLHLSHSRRRLEHGNIGRLVTADLWRAQDNPACSRQSYNHSGMLPRSGGRASGLVNYKVTPCSLLPVMAHPAQTIPDRL